MPMPIPDLMPPQCLSSVIVVGISAGVVVADDKGASSLLRSSPLDESSRLSSPPMPSPDGASSRPSRPVLTGTGRSTDPEFAHPPVHPRANHIRPIVVRHHAMAMQKAVVNAACAAPVPAENIAVFHPGGVRVRGERLVPPGRVDCRSRRSLLSTQHAGQGGAAAVQPLGQPFRASDAASPSTSR